MKEDGRIRRTNDAEALAHDHAVRALDQQAGVLDNVRARTATVIAVTALVATFLGSQTLQANSHGHKWLDAAAFGPLIAFALSIYWAIRVLQPTVKPDRGRPRAEQVGLRFSLDANAILDAGQEENEGVRASVARSAQAQWTSNVTIIESKLRDFNRATWALLFQVALWIVLLIGKGVS